MMSSYKVLSFIHMHAHIEARGLACFVPLIWRACTCPQEPLWAVPSRIVHIYMPCMFVTTFAQLSWVTECYRGGSMCTMPPLWHQAAIVLPSWSIMSSKDWPCSRGRGPITRLITQAWLLLSGVVPGHLSLLLSGEKEEESKCVKECERERERQWPGERNSSKDGVKEGRRMTSEFGNQARTCKIVEDEEKVFHLRLSDVVLIQRLQDK